jgi:hypothetical protein
MVYACGVVGKKSLSMPKVINIFPIFSFMVLHLICDAILVKFCIWCEKRIEFFFQYWGLNPGPSP